MTPAYDRELIAEFLDELASFTDHGDAIRTQARLLREAANAEAANVETVDSRSRMRRIAAEKGEPAPRFDASEDGPLLSQLQQVEDALQARDMGHEAGVVQCAIRRLAASGQGVE